MAWYNIVPIIFSGLSLLGIGAYFAERMKHRAGKKNNKEDQVEKKKAEDAAKLKALEHEQYKAELTAIINMAIAPIASDVAQIKNDLAKNTEGTITLLRTDMKNNLDAYKQRGYASAGDRANWNELYNTYDRLGGNHFREYVDGWKEELLILPFKKQTTKRININRVRSKAKKEESSNGK